MTLGEDAYSLSIQKSIASVAGEKWSLGTIYAPLERLEKRGLIRSAFSESAPERGGRKKRLYQLTKDGYMALDQLKKVQEAFWQQMPGLLTHKS